MDINDLLPQVTPECEKVSTLLAVNALRNAARHFCEESTAWRKQLDPINIVNGGTYTLALPTNSQLVSVIKPVIHNGKPVGYKSLHELDNDYLLWRDKRGEQAEFFTMLSATSLRLYPAPSIPKTGALLVQVALKPSMSSLVIDDYIAGDYGEHIANLAKAILMAMPGKPWSNPELAIYYRSLTDAAIQESLSKVVSGYIKGKADRNNRTRPHYF